MTWNKNMDEAPRDGTVCIFWLCTDKCFPDQTANFYYANTPKRNARMFKLAHPEGEGWYWEEGYQEKLKRPDLVKGWMLYPQPPEVEG